MNIEELQALCNSFPAVTEDIKWDNDLCFSVGGKMFCVASLDQPLRISFKVGDEEFNELSTRIGFIPAPYMARAKWVSVVDVSCLPQHELRQLISQSYNLVREKLTIKMRKQLGIN
ncbi:MAG: MmcQ/YjbR family DNA-binding protein [Cyclobacteriaceae bacterium]|nr:MmcQ/YjbR family DNA-binding protein [Cyclobacteriaceae bacterium]